MGMQMTPLSSVKCQMFKSNFRTRDGREQCAPTRYIDISLGGGPDMCLDSWISLLLSTIFTTNTDKAVQDLDFQKVSLLKYTVHCTEPVRQTKNI